MATETVPFTVWHDGVQTGSGTETNTLTPDETDQQAIRANIASARTALLNATQAVNGATSATALAALQQYVSANNQAWNALLPALKYIADRLAS